MYLILRFIQNIDYLCVFITSEATNLQMKLVKVELIQFYLANLIQLVVLLIH